MKFDVNDFQNEIDAIKEKIEIFQRAEEKADESFLEVGNILVGVKNDKQLEDKIFTQLKKEVAKTDNLLNNIYRIFLSTGSSIKPRQQQPNRSHRPHLVPLHASANN